MLTTGLKDQEKDLRLFRYSEEVRHELYAILDYWITYMPDEQQGGFYGTVRDAVPPGRDAPKGIVLNSRILWAFAAAYPVTQSDVHLAMARRAFDYIQRHFVDHEYGGVYWSVEAGGRVKEGKKQVYGLAFCIYGVTEYYRATGDKEALRLANDLFECIEGYSRDPRWGGYVEAFTRDWQPIADLRLSEKDDNEAKTMNTHLHLIEAYANLYSVQPGQTLRERIVDLLELFGRYFINRKNNHLHLFMDEHWTVKSSLQSFGHDIEAAWLLQRCAEIIEYSLYINRSREWAVQLADAAAEGLDKDGGLWYEYDPGKDHLVMEKHWWPQAEAMVGFFNAYELSGNEKYLQQSLHSWTFIKKHLKDTYRGEWYWGVYADYTIMDKEKAGFWKCPYHNVRACIEIINRVTTMKR